MEKVEIEAGLFYTAYNLEKMYRHVMKALGEDKKIPPLIAPSRQGTRVIDLGEDKKILL